MFEKLAQQLEVEKLKYYILIVLVSVCVYAYSASTGWKFMGSDTEKWSPEGNVRNYHK